MRYLLSICFSIFSSICFAQADTIRKVEPDMETSFENYELLLMAVVGLLLLIGLRFWFKKTRK